MTISVCVVGAGIIGLSTALQILQNNSNSKYEVTIVAEKFGRGTTSSAAGAILEPYSVGNTPIHMQKRWFSKTLDWIAQLGNDNPGLIGIHQLQINYFFTDDKPDPYWKDWLPGFRKVTAIEKKIACRNSSVNGWCLSTFCIDTSKYMAWLTKRIEDFGGRFQEKKLTSLNQLSSYDIIVNCSGIGAYSLVPDPSVTPARGQVMRVKAPWLQHSCVYEDDKTISYIFPRQLFQSGIVVLGGTYQVGNWNTNIDKNDSKKIFENCCKLIPSLKNAEIIEETVGLRPTRPSVRLEIERRNVDQKEIKIIHNYGHGGAGITLHWGSAIDAYKLVKQLSSQGKLLSKL
ncbi:D-aspartate oxidase [Trichoplax sp. H2]|nr:D-aspartate oxidase [Trichoplax sp. H2]|eukprot:RDD41237.1 D-aspartate oxidase [Trichoplax sp. H2]